MEKFRPHLTPTLKSGLAYGGGLALGNLIAALIFSVVSLERFSPGNDVMRLVTGILLAFLISGLGAAVGAFLGGYTLPMVDPPKGKWNYAWKSAVTLGVIYGVLLYPVFLVLALFSFYNISGIPVWLFMVIFAIVGLLVGLLFGLIFGSWTVGLRRAWRVTGYAALGFGVGGLGLGLGIYGVINSFALGGFSLAGRIAALFGLFVFGLAGGVAVAMAYARYASEPPQDKPIFGWLTPARRWIIAIGIVLLLFAFIVRPVLSLMRNTFQPQDANLSTALVSQTVGTHWLDPVDLSAEFDLGAAGAAQIDVADGGQVGLTWLSDGSVMFMPGAWDVAAKMASWQNPVTVSSGNDTVEAPQIAVDSQGQAHIVWAEAGTILYSLCDAGGCTEPEVVSAASSLACAADAGVHQAPAIAIDANDTLMLVWETDADVLPALTWSVEDLPVNAVGECVPTGDLTKVRQPRVAAAANGRFGFVFTAGVDENNTVNRVDYDGGWGELVEVGNGRYPEIYFDGNNDAHVVWCSQNSVVYRQKQEESESVITPCVNRPQIGVDSNGYSHIVWYGNTIQSVLGKISADSVLYEIAQFDEGWTQSTIIDRTGNQIQPAITVDDQGTLHMVSTVGEGADKNLRYQAQVQYSCEGYELTRLAQVLYDVTRQEKYRDPDTPVPYCQNRYDNLVFTPSADPAYSDMEPLVNGAYDQMAQLADTARYEVLFATMWYDPDYAGESPGFVIASAVADLYNKVKANPENYPRGLTVRILLGNPPEAATGDFTGQLWNVIEDIRTAGVPTMVDPEIGWNLEVADYKGSLPHSHAKMIVVDGKTAIAAGYNMTYEHYGVNHPSGAGGGRNDLGIQVTGPVVQDAVLAFDDLWVGSDQRLCTNLDPFYELWQASCYDFKAEGRHVPEVMKYYIPEGDTTAFSMFRSNVRDEADWQVANALAAAETSIDTIQVNFTMEMICDLDILYEVCTFNEALPYMQSLVAAAENGAKVRILIKGEPADGIESMVGVENLAEEVARRGLEEQFELRFFDGPMHYKSINIDNELVIVGSQNFHYSAMSPLNGLVEYNLGVVDEQAVEDYSRLFEYHWERGIPLELKSDY
jgi:MFS family permease